MKISIKDIRPEGLEVADKIPLDILGLTEREGLQFISPLHVQARAEKIKNAVLVKTTLDGRYTSFCSRCLKEIERDWAGRFSFDFPVDRNTEFIEMDEDIRQEVLLHLPQRILCQEDCQGLCPSCGADLNKESCKCARSLNNAESKTSTF